MKKLTVNAWFDAKDIFNDETFARYEEIEFVVKAKTHGEAMAEIYDKLDYDALELENQTGYRIIPGFTYTEETL